MISIYNIENLSIYRFVFRYIDSNMYVIIENNEALIIDPHFSKSMQKLLYENQIKNILVLLTHEHYDHICGIDWLSKHFNITLICQKACAKSILKNTRPLLISFILEERDRLNGTNNLEHFNKEYKAFSYNADIIFDDKFFYKWQNHHLAFYATPGHSFGSCCIVFDDKIIFSGDSLFKDIPIITRFPGGNTKDYKNITIPFLESLDRNLIVLSGHKESFRLIDVFLGEKINVAIR
ncbi:hypothetical protein CCY99_08055 [Helicobacter sp. 16-1353]|uniref:MBL fold metallo-hydrolase n=1 Tax=Helicobacter sp. 16-1353 TaxID=2004996 RepID=UPI000DCE3E07|nr:MBL fold metallo-hydrolase [Helicobacter sp. 16-1353]RAX51902.1 hypothetical protein CCY99_08055 [Helicobacter sp. 16-1353]